jgi:DNA polymerase elongation subunit (family B)
MCPMKPTTKIRFTKPQIALLMRAHPNCNLDRLTELLDAVGAPHVGERTEKQLIAAFCEKIAELSPQLVTFNGNSFDLPVLRYRAMVHGADLNRPESSQRNRVLKPKF